MRRSTASIHRPNGLSRRRFLGVAGGVVGGTAAGLLTPGLWHATAGAQTAAASGRPLRTLVVVDMEGGNDALNTLVPATGRYHDLRPTLALGDDELLSFAGLDYGVHPALAPLESLWDAGHLAAFHGIGLPEQSRSHFVAQDAWRSARPGEPARSGWLGRWLEATAPEVEVPLRAISLGADTLAAQSESGRPVAVQSVEDHRLIPPRGNNAVVAAMAAMGAAPADGLLGEARRALPDTIASVDQLQSIIAGVVSSDRSGNADDGDGVDDEFAPDPTATLFAATREIIQAEVGTRVIYITIDGFDTHSVQAQRQQLLLDGIARGVRGLFDGLADSGHADDTLVLTTSEFGRRAAENGSAGTDHGTGGAAFLIGPAVTGPVVHGGADLDDLANGDLPLTLDARSVYDSALRWLGGSAEVSEQVLGGDWSGLDVLRS